MISGGNSSMRVRQVSFQIIEADLAESSRRAFAYFGYKVNVATIAVCIILFVFNCHLLAFFKGYCRKPYDQSALVHFKF